MDSDKFCLRWNEFEENIRHSFKVLRNEKTLFDVTLATDDGHQIQAHRVILSAGSDFFSDIFTKCHQSNMFIYLKGIRRKLLENVIEFLYNGKTFVTHEEFNSFLKIAQELKVKGLRSSGAKIDDSIQSQEVSEAGSKQRVNVFPENIGSYDRELKAAEFKLQKPIKVDSCNEQITVSENEHESLAKNDDSLNEQLEEAIEHYRGIWKCKFCDKTSYSRGNIKMHAEVHIVGLRHTCNVCMKTFATRTSLAAHVSHIHSSKRYSCATCGKVNMNKMNVYNHKRNCNGTPEEQINMV